MGALGWVSAHKNKFPNQGYIIFSHLCLLQCVAIIRAVVRFEKIPKRTDLAVISPNYYQMSDNPSVNMAPFITVAMREAMVCWRLKQHMTALQISVLVGCSERAVYKVLRLHRVYYGQVTNPFKYSQQGSSLGLPKFGPEPRFKP